MSDIRFLIADDSAAVHTFLTQLLESYGFEPTLIKTAATPEKAVDLIASFQPDFLLSNGFEDAAITGLALGALAQKHRTDSRFALLCKTATTDTKEAAQAAGALFVLAKPFTAADLRLALRGAMDNMAVEHPKLAAHVNAQAANALAAGAATATAAAKAQSAHGQPRPAAPPQIRIKQHKPGDTVFYQGRPATVKYVILRRGELVMQLDGHTGLVAASQVQAG